MNSQREKRPSSPHLTIYQPQVSVDTLRTLLSGFKFGGHLGEKVFTHRFRRENEVVNPDRRMTTSSYHMLKSSAFCINSCLRVFADDQITWLASIANRVTGSALSVALYAASITYLFHPYFPAMESANIVQLVHDLPTWVKGSAKLLFAVPFTFHTFNGIRHLAWDVGYGMSILLVVGNEVGVAGRLDDACRSGAVNCGGLFYG